MKKLFIATTTLIVTATLSFSLMANPQAKKDPGTTKMEPNPPATMQRGQKVSLTCKPGQGKDVSTPLYVKNPTAQDLPSGVVVHWSSVAGGTANGTETTTVVLKKNSGNEIKLMGPAGNQGSCQAWVVK